ncbi:hypothetical protein HWV62_33923 [Athelia sp. TMB]|nr:hypothetical protein HWV62_33923 [Athelia sp. TMB]
MIVTLPTSDQRCPTRGYLFEAETLHASSPVVILAVATATPAAFYEPFASWLSSSHALTILVVDYRYNGISFPEGVDVADSKARTTALVEGRYTTITKHWVEDLHAAFRFVRERYLGRDISYIGHDVGAHIAPLVQSPEDHVIRNLFLGTTLQYHGYYPNSDEHMRQLQSVEKFVIELGYYPSSQLGRGEDGPAGVGLETHRWCRFPRYIATDYPEAYDHYKGRALTIIFTDDAQLPPPPKPACFTVDKFLNTMPQADITRVVIDPKSLGWGPVGHINAFCTTHRKGLWPALAKWIKYGELCPALQGERWESSGLGGLGEELDCAGGRGRKSGTCQLWRLASSEFLQPASPITRLQLDLSDRRIFSSIYNTKTTTYRMTAKWTDSLAQVLQPPSDSTMRQESPRKSRHPAGQMWKSALAQALHSDLSLGICSVRRLVRLEMLGLSGVIAYTLPGNSADQKEQTHLTIDSIFGNDELEDDGMDVEVLMDTVQARLIYFPVYACTSFGAGQAMNAFIHSEKLKPKSLPNGFAVDIAPFTTFNELAQIRHPASYPEASVLDFLKSDLLKRKRHLMRVRGNPHAGAIVGQESTPYAWRDLARKLIERKEARARAAKAEEEDGQEMDETLLDSDSTDDTLGPETPVEAIKSKQVFSGADLTPLLLPLSSKDGNQDATDSCDVFGGPDTVFILSADESKERKSLFATISSIDGGLAKMLKSSGKGNQENVPAALPQT